MDKETIRVNEIINAFPESETLAMRELIKINEAEELYIRKNITPMIAKISHGNPDREALISIIFAMHYDVLSVYRRRRKHLTTIMKSICFRNGSLQQIPDYDIVDLCETLDINLNTSLMALCPFHDDTNPSFKVYHDKNKWRCFGCNRHGDGIDLVMNLMDITFKQAISWMMQTVISK